MSAMGGRGRRGRRRRRERLAKRGQGIWILPPSNLTRARNTSDGHNQGSIVEEQKALVGRIVRIYWPKDRKYYEARVDAFDEVTRKYKLLYAKDDIDKDK